MENEQVEFRV